MNNYSAIFNIDIFLDTLKNISDYFEKKIYIIEEKFNFLQFRISHPGSVDNNYFKSICLEEKKLDIIEALERKKEMSSAIKETLISIHNSSEVYSNAEPVNSNASSTTTAGRFKSLEEIYKYCDEKINEQSSSIWSYFFYSKQDSFILLNTFSEYFFSGSIDPDFVMIMKPRCKTKLCSAINAIYYRFGDGCLKYNNEFLSLLQKLSVFKKDSQTQIYNSVIRSPN